MTLNILSIDQGEEYFAPVYTVQTEWEATMVRLFSRPNGMYEGVLLYAIESGMFSGLTVKPGDKITFSTIGKPM